MAANTQFLQNGTDIGNIYVTKEFVMEYYPDLIPSMLTPQLWTWGDNASGRLGDGTITNRSSPGTTAGGGTNWKQVSCGYGHSAAIKTDGTLWTWGDNYNGQLGDFIFNRSSPGTTAGGGTNWKQVACGNRHTAAIKTDGTLWTCGYNLNGELGDDTQTDRVSLGTTAGGGTNWKQVSCGEIHTAAVKTDGTLWTWGANYHGNLGDGTGTFRSSPGTTAGGGTNWRQVSCGTNCTAAVKTDGTLWTCGYNGHGQLGDGTETERSSLATTAGGGTNWKQVACGRFHIAAIKTDGTIWTWGRNLYGGLGDGTGTPRSSPETTAGGGANWKQVSGGSDYTAAIKTDGTLWTWGYNNFENLGDGTTNNSSSPGTVVGGGTNWKQIACGYGHTAAISESEGW
jgi:alpha-tubulin suppressor-like RCC1 family protein